MRFRRMRYAIWLPLAAKAVACLGAAGATKPLAAAAKSARVRALIILEMLGRLHVASAPAAASFSALALLLYTTELQPCPTCKSSRCVAGEAADRPLTSLGERRRRFLDRTGFAAKWVADHWSTRARPPAQRRCLEIVANTSYASALAEEQNSDLSCKTESLLSSQSERCCDSRF